MARSSNKKQEILQFLTDFIRENGYAPSVREICHAVGLQSTATVHYHLNALRDEGLIRSRRVGKHVLYTLDDDHVYEAVAMTMEHIHHRH